MKNSKVIIITIISIFLVIPFLTNAQSGKVDFKAEQDVPTIHHSSPAGAIGIVKTKTQVKFEIRKGKPFGFTTIKKYKFIATEKTKSTTKIETTEFQPFLRKNKYQLKK